jgi:uncharacterized membrane protein
METKILQNEVKNFYIQINKSHNKTKSENNIKQLKLSIYKEKLRYMYKGWSGKRP